MAASNLAVTHAQTGLVTAEVAYAERISPSFVRVTLRSDELHDWRHLGFDQWFRLALPVAGSATHFDRLSDRFDMRGYLRYLTLPKATRPTIRNYTVRDFRPELGEMDVDFVIHGAPNDAGGAGGAGGAGTDAGAAGVAGPWAESLPVGAHVALIDQGCGYRHVEGTNRVVLVGDESALPAVLGILRDLPEDSVGDAIIEVPDAADQQPVLSPVGVRVQWAVRGSHVPRRGTVEQSTARPDIIPGNGADASGAGVSGAGVSGAYVISSDVISTEVMSTDAPPGSAALALLTALPTWEGPVSAFVAGEQKLAAGGRRHLVNERGVAKSAIDFCGYWKRR